MAPVPDTADPALATFVPFANQSNSTELGSFRTLRPKVRNYDLNGTVSTRVAPWLTANATVRLNRNISRASRGLPPALFVLSPNNAFSPFSNEVGLAFYGSTPLRSRSERTGGEGRITLNGKLGRWTSHFNARHAESKDIFDTQRQTSSSPIVLDDSIDPFGSDILNLTDIRTDRSTSRSITNHAQLSFTGPALALPAGEVQATVEGILAGARVRSHSEFSGTVGDRSFRRNEQSIRGALDIPLASRANGFGAAIGDLNATAEYARLHYSDAGSLDRYALGLTWEPVERLRLRSAVEGTDTPASMQLLGAPTVETPDVRVFDPLTGETVDVLQITGGNPLLRPEETRIYRLSGLARLVPRLNLQLNSEFTDTYQRNFISSLPPTSLAVMLAFPDRYIRSPDGTLTTIDLRPVNFESHREKRLRWGLSMRTKLREGNILGSRAVESTEPEMEPGDDAESQPQPVARRGRSLLESRSGGTRTEMLRFSPVMVVNLRAFADMRRVLPNSRLARGLRLSVDVVNLFNDRQSVRDPFGNTPLQYQPGYRDPIGRTIEFEIRKVF